ncbi:MAG: hypothetical protein KGY42_09275 [Desulfobacterales bacterium]|nr:hypothetical protein [Desulfobacterales bacterium]
MKPIKLFIFCVLAGLLISFPAHGIGAEEAASIADLYSGARGGQSFFQPNETELARARRLFGRMFSGDFFQQGIEKPGWKTLGFRAVRVKQEGREYVAVIEDGAKKGRGFYLFADMPDSRTALMVPHGTKDLQTGKIGVKLMSGGEFVGGAFNTMPRYTESGDRNQKQDMAHAKGTYFVAYTKAFADVFPRGRLVQLHGFAKEKRETKAGRKADVIVSSGSAILPPDIYELTDCLRQTQFHVALYPLEVGELGGTTNISGNVLQIFGHSGFVHFEMSYPLRKKMIGSPQLLETFENCLELGK